VNKSERFFVGVVLIATSLCLGFLVLGLGLMLRLLFG